MTPGHLSEASFDYSSIDLEEKSQTSSTDTTLNNDIDDGANGERKLSINEDKVNVEASLNQDSTLVRSELSTVSSKNSSQEKKLCAVISTMPKCDHLSSLSIKDTVSQSKEWEGLKEPKKARIPRTASKSNDFEVNALEKQKRHLTSHAEDITFALNLNVNPSLLSDRDLAQQSREEQDTESQDMGGEKSPVAVVSSGACCISLMCVRTLFQ